MNQKIEKERQIDELLKLFEKLLIKYIKTLFKQSEWKKPITDKEAENVLSNIGIRILSRNLKSNNINI